MKPRKPPRRQVFVLTAEEKRVVAVVVGAFLLGLGTMHYRANHPPIPAALKEKEVRGKKEAAGKARTASASASPRARPPRRARTPGPMNADEE
jgi:hypothetical protein